MIKHKGDITDAFKLSDGSIVTYIYKGKRIQKKLKIALEKYLLKNKIFSYA